MENDSGQYKADNDNVKKINAKFSDLSRISEQMELEQKPLASPDEQNNDGPQQTDTEVALQRLLEKLALLETRLSPLSPDEQNNDGPQQNDPDIASQVAKETTLQQPHTAVSKSTDSKLLLFEERSEMHLQSLNKAITNFENSNYSLKKPKRQTVADINQCFESAKQLMHESEHELFGTLLSEVQARPIEWLWPGRIPLGKITILDGDPGTGKSLIAMNIAACVSAGHPMPDGTTGIKGGVILIAPEDSSSDTIKPRVEVIGGDPNQLLLIDNVPYFDPKRMAMFDSPFSLSRDLNDLEKTIKRRKAKLVILDPLTAVLGHDVSASNDQDMREVLTPLAKLAARTKCAFLIIRHLNKGNSTNPLYRGAGSIGIIGAARMGLIVVRVPYDEHKYILATSKNNLSKHASHLIYQIVENEQNIPYIQWLGEINENVSNLLRPPTNLSLEHQEILRVLRETNGSLDPKGIAELTGQNVEAVRVILSRMYERGEIARPSRGRYASLNQVIVREIHPAMLPERSETIDRSDMNDTNDIKVTNSGGVD